MFKMFSSRSKDTIYTIMNKLSGVLFDNEAIVQIITRLNFGVLKNAV